VHGVDVLITDAVRGALDPRFALRALPPVPVKGLGAPLATWAVEHFPGE
jgi:class 3 adenylate cyclase